MLLVFFANGFYVPFTPDDLNYMKTDQPGFLLSLMSWQNFFHGAGWAGDLQNTSFDRFLHFASFALNYKIDGFNVLGYHLINWGLHFGVVTLLYFFINTWLHDHAARKPLAFFSALLFALHPLAVQVATYTPQRCESLSAIFYLAALLLYLRQRQRWEDHPPRAHSLALLALAIAVFFALGLKAKETIITLPLALCALELFALARSPRSWQWRIGLITTLCLASASYLLWHFRNILWPAQGSPLTAFTSGLANSKYAGLEYPITQLRVNITYWRILFLPLGLHWDYDYPLFHSLWNWPVLGSLLAHLVLLLGAWRWRHHRPLAAFAIFFWYLAHLPSAVVNSANELVFEYRMYLPALFIWAAIAQEIWHRTVRQAQWRWLLLALALFFGVQSFNYNRAWATLDGFFLHSIKHSPNKARPYHNLGVTAFKSRGDHRQAHDYFTQALNRDPQYATAYLLRALARIELKMFAQALQDCDQALRLFTNRMYLGHAHYHKARAWFALQQPQYAMDELAKAEALQPELSGIFVLRGFLFYQVAKDIPRACLSWQRACQLGECQQLHTLKDCDGNP